MRRALDIVAALALLYAVGVTALASLPAWRHLPDLPISVTTGSCPATPIALAADPDLLVPLVLASGVEHGTETPAAAESCRRMAALVREADSFYELVPDRFVCRSIRRHAHDLWLEADLWPGPHMWIVDGELIGAGKPGFAEKLRAAGLQYALVDGRVAIVPVVGTGA
jgi:hypothetical protein